MNDNDAIRTRQINLKRLYETPPWDWPEAADKIFLEILSDNHADSSDRILTAELAGDFTVINDKLVDVLLTILQNEDESEELRGRAAISLGPILEYADTSGFEDPDDNPISEDTFRNVQKSLRRLYQDAAVPNNVRRQILEASVRATLDWHQDAIRTAYSSDDEDWVLTSVFSMRWVRGFDKQITESLDSSNRDVHFQAVCAAGNWEVDTAWSHISGLIRKKVTDKPLLLAAIEAAAVIRPEEAGLVLLDLTDSDDDDIAGAALEAMAMAAD